MLFNLWRINKKAEVKNADLFNKKLTFDNVHEIIGDSSDVQIKKVFIKDHLDFDLKCIYIDGLIDTEILDQNFLKPLATESIYSNVKNQKELENLIKQGSIYHMSQTEITDIEKAVNKLIDGFVLLIFDELNKAIAFEARDIPKRGITESSNENVIKGARDSFIENLRTNTALIRRKLKSPYLRIETMMLGDVTPNSISIVYMNNVVDNDNLAKLKEKLNKIKIDDLISSGRLEEALIDNPHSIFPQLLYTERTDKFCANIADGKIGILIDGLSVSYIVPAVMAMFMQAPEDYSANHIIASFLRILRYICLFIAVLLPGFYIAITTFHQEMLPTELVISILKSKEGVPFTSVMEVLFMLIAFEVIIEASLRLPQSIGGAISIIGGLVVGDAAVSAKFVSPAVVVIVSISAIASFVIPNQGFSNAIRISRIAVLIVSAIGGLFGMTIALIFLIYQMCSIESLGVPYLVPYSSNEGKNLSKDTIIRGRYEK